VFLRFFGLGVLAFQVRKRYVQRLVTRPDLTIEEIRTKSINTRAFIVTNIGLESATRSRPVELGAESLRQPLVFAAVLQLPWRPQPASF